MTWGLARYVASRVALAFSRPARERTAPPIGLHGRVQNTGPKSRANGANTPGNTYDLTARAIRLHNRHKGRAKRYLDVHRTLSKGSYSK